MGWSAHPDGSGGSKAATLAYPQPWVTLLVLGPVFFGLTDGCFRQNKPPPPTPKPMIVESAMTPAPGPTMECTEFEASMTSCLNGGKCVAIEDYPGSRTAICHCPAEYWGPRCAEFKPIFEILGVRQGRVRTAHIAAGVTVCVVVMFIVLLVVFVWLRKRNRNANTNKANNSRTAQNGYRLEDGTALPMNGMQGSEREKEGIIPSNGNTENGTALEVEHYADHDDYNADEKQPMNSTAYDYDTVDNVDSSAEDKV